MPLIRFFDVQRCGNFERRVLLLRTWHAKRGRTSGGLNSVILNIFELPIFFSWFALHFIFFISFYATCCWKVVCISEVLDLKEKWDNYIASWRRPGTVGQAFHVRPSDSRPREAKQFPKGIARKIHRKLENSTFLHPLWFYEYTLCI